MPSSPASEGSPPTAEQPPAEAPVEQGQDQREQAPANGELAAMEDRYKRALADLDNYRKRSARETERRVEESREAILRDWLEALDSVERAMAMDPAGPAADGLRAVLEQMEQILARYGVRRLGARGERFDPAVHEAVGVRPTDEVPDLTILEVARSGFALGDRVLRPAQVVVSRAPDREA